MLSRAAHLCNCERVVESARGYGGDINPSKLRGKVQAASVLWPIKMLRANNITNSSSLLTALGDSGRIFTTVLQRVDRNIYVC
jgi:hypothetical protein